MVEDIAFYALYKSIVLILPYKADDSCLFIGLTEMQQHMYITDMCTNRKKIFIFYHTSYVRKECKKQLLGWEKEIRSLTASVCLLRGDFTVFEIIYFPLKVIFLAFKTLFSFL